MIRNNLGYIFECKKDIKGNIGIKESFSFSVRGNIKRVSAIFGIDVKGKIVSPLYYDKSIGLTSLATLVDEETFDEDIAKFVRSNRATYSLSSVTYLICSVEAKINIETGEWISDESKINFYVAKASQSLGKLVNSTSEEWGILCDIAASSGKLNTFQVSEGVLNAYKDLVLSQLSELVKGDKKEYIAGRLAKGGA